MAESLSRPQFDGNSGAKFDDIARLFDSFVLVPSEMEVQRHVGVLLVKRNQYAPHGCSRGSSPRGMQQWSK